MTIYEAIKKEFPGVLVMHLRNEKSEIYGYGVVGHNKYIEFDSEGNLIRYKILENN